MPSDLTRRFIYCHDDLKARGLIKSARQFAQMLSFQPQNLSEILRGKREAPLELVKRGIAVFGINPTYLFTGEGACFLDQSGKDNFRVLTVVTDDQNKERIVHIPIPAQAGYTQAITEPYFLEQLPSYNLPDDRFAHGSFRSFDVAGDSMEPTLQAGDKVICSYVDPSDWLANLHDLHVYVIVTREGVMVKRIVNQLHRHRHFELISDNQYYKTIRMNVGEVKELWMVKARISDFSHHMPKHEESVLQHLNETIAQQSSLIQQLHQKIEAITAL